MNQRSFFFTSSLRCCEPSEYVLNIDTLTNDNKNLRQTRNYADCSDSHSTLGIGVVMVAVQGKSCKALMLELQGSDARAARL